MHSIASSLRQIVVNLLFQLEKFKNTEIAIEVYGNTTKTTQFNHIQIDFCVVLMETVHRYTLQTMLRAINYNCSDKQKM